MAASPAHAPLVSVVIASYNTCALLRECLRSLEACPSRSEWEVYVVDNASCDGSAEMVEREFPQVRLLRNVRNRGYAYANNLALRQARGRYLLLLNPDTVVAPNAIDHLVAALEADPDAAIAGPKLIRPDGSLDLACRRSFPTPSVALYRLLGLSKLFPRSRRFARYNLTYLDPDEPGEVDAVVGACMLVRAAAMARVGLLDERFFMYGEDLDWAYRFRQDGWRVLYRPEAVVVHHKGAASRRESERALRAFYQAMAIFYDKHYARDGSPLARGAVRAAIALRYSWARLRNTLRPPEARHVST